MSPDYRSGVKESPDCAPAKASARLVVEVEIAVWGDPETGYGDLKMNLEDIANTAFENGRITANGYMEMEVVSFEAHVERM